jgi:putative transposase
MVEREHAELSVVTQTRLLELDRSGVYYVPVMVSAEELAIKQQIDELYIRWPFYGSRKIADELGINRKAAQRHMREMGIAGICPGPNLSKKAAKAGVFPYLVSSRDKWWSKAGIDGVVIRQRKTMNGHQRVPVLHDDDADSGQSCSRSLMALRTAASSTIFFLSEAAAMREAVPS